MVILSLHIIFYLYVRLPQLVNVHVLLNVSVLFITVKASLTPHRQRCIIDDRKKYAPLSPPWGTKCLSI